MGALRDVDTVVPMSLADRINELLSGDLLRFGVFCRRLESRRAFRG